MLTNHSKDVESFLDQNFQSGEGVQEHILSAMRYSLLQRGAKRFRANLACFTVEALGHQIEKVLPFAAALECIHTYSLIHDDLPSMDNDDIRRGEPTNHKVFGEAKALLAGDGLLTEAFGLIGRGYASQPEVGLKLVALLSKACGMQGMISGQVRDIESMNHPLEKLEQLKLMHEQKTGALIQAAIDGGGVVGSATSDQAKQLHQFGQNLGLAFQVKDDLLDSSDDKGMSYTKFMGIDGAQNFLQELTKECLTKLSDWGYEADSLREMANYNLKRKQ